MCIISNLSRKFLPNRGSRFVVKFGCETSPLHFSRLTDAIHLSVCDVLDTKKPNK